MAEGWLALLPPLTPAGRREQGMNVCVCARVCTCECECECECKCVCVRACVRACVGESLTRCPGGKGL